jgi:hypothetical protein
LTVGSNTLGSASGALNATLDSNGFIAGTFDIPFSPAAAGNLTINATFTPSTPNYLGSSTTSSASVTVANNEGFTLMPVGAPNCANQATCIIIPASGQTATSPVTVTSIGLSGTVTLTCAVSPTNPADLDVPGCSFTLNGAANSTVSLTGNGSSGQRMLKVTTTARSVLPPTTQVQRRDWFLAGLTLSLVGCSFLLMNVRTRKLRPALTFALLLVLIAGVAGGCSGGGGSPANNPGTGSSGTGGSGGSGSGSGGSGGGAMSNPGTTPDVYIVTVTATPSAGTAIQTQFFAIVE